MEFSDHREHDDHREDDTLEGKTRRDYRESKQDEYFEVDDSYDEVVFPRVRTWPGSEVFEIRDTEDTKEIEFFKEPPGQSTDEAPSTAGSTLPDMNAYLGDFSKMVFSEVQQIVGRVAWKEWLVTDDGRTLDITEKLSESVREKLGGGCRVVLELSSGAFFCEWGPKTRWGYTEKISYDTSYDAGKLWATVTTSIRKSLDEQLLAISQSPRQWINQLSVKAITNEGNSSRLSVVCSQGEVTCHLKGIIEGGVATDLGARLLSKQKLESPFYHEEGPISATREFSYEQSKALLDALIEKGLVSLQPPKVAEPSPELQQSQSSLPEKATVKQEVSPKPVNPPQPEVDPQEVWRDLICTEALTVIKSCNGREWRKSEHGISLDITDLVSESITERLATGERLIVKREKDTVVFYVLTHESEQESRVLTLSGWAAKPFLAAIQEKMEKLTDELDKECDALAKTIDTWITNLPEDAFEGYQKGDFWQYIGCKQGNYRLVLNRKPCVLGNRELIFFDSAKIVISAGPVVFEKNPDDMDMVDAAISTVLARSPAALAGFRLSDQEHQAKILKETPPKVVSRWESLKGKLTGWMDIFGGASRND